MSEAKQISLGIQGILNAVIGSYKAADGAVDFVAGVGLSAFTEGASTTVAAVGAYEFISGGGQAVTGASQLNRAATGDGGPETPLEQGAAIASGPVFGGIVLMSTGNPSDAERAANFESFFVLGTGLINSSSVSNLISGAVDSGLATLGMGDNGTCQP